MTAPAWTTHTGQAATRIVDALAELGDFFTDNPELCEPARVDVIASIRASSRDEALRILRQYAAALETQVGAHVAESGATHHSVEAVFGPIRVRLFWIDHTTTAAAARVDAHITTATALLTPDAPQHGDPR